MPPRNRADLELLMEALRVYRKYNNNARGIIGRKLTLLRTYLIEIGEVK